MVAINVSLTDEDIALLDDVARVLETTLGPCPVGCACVIHQMQALVTNIYIQTGVGDYGLETIEGLNH